MPTEGWSTVAIRDEFYAQLVEAAGKDGRSVANYLEWQLLKKGIVKAASLQTVKSGG